MISINSEKSSKFNHNVSEKNSVSIKRISFFLYIFSIFVFIILNEIYFSNYIQNIYNNSNGTSHFANLHDHIIYETFIQYVANGESPFVFGNNFGIASVYFFLNEVFEINDYVVLSHYVNSFIFLCIAIYAFKVLKFFRIHLVFSVFIVFNPANFYFLSLINKDSFTILFILMFIYYLTKEKYFIFLILVVASSVIRIQLPLFAITLCFLINFKKTSVKKKIIYIYILSSIGAVLLEHKISLIDIEQMDSSLGFGITKLVRKLNQQYYIGSFFLNPLKITQYFFDYAQAFKYLFHTDAFIFTRVKDICNLIFLPISLLSLFMFFSLRNTFQKRGLNIFLYVIVSFFAVWLINPIINYRYVSIFIPYILIPGLYSTAYLLRAK